MPTKVEKHSMRVKRRLAARDDAYLASLIAAGQRSPDSPGKLQTIGREESPSGGRSGAAHAPAGFGIKASSIALARLKAGRAWSRSM